MSVFDKFTNLYSLSKTLRLELKPLPATREFLKMDELEKEKLFPKDREKAENYQKLKYYLDLLHREFINEALAIFKKEDEYIDFEGFFNKIEASTVSDDNEVNDNSDDEEKDSYKSIRSKIVDKFKSKTYLFDKDVIDKLEKTFKEENGTKFILRIDKKEQLPDAQNIIFTNTEGKEETIFQNFKGFTGYLRGFHENRKNLYEDDGKAGRVATRIIDQNLPRFFANIKKYKELLEKYPELLNNFTVHMGKYLDGQNQKSSKVFNSFTKQGKNWNKVFEPNYYNHCFLQVDIDFYNSLIRKLNEDINQYSQKLKSENKKGVTESETSKKASKLPFFEKLHKQILGEVKKKSDFIDITQDTLGDYLKNFKNHSNAKLELSKEILESIFKGQDIEGIYISNKAINTISSKWFLSWDFFGGKILEKQNEGLSESKKRKKIEEFKFSLYKIKELLEEMKESKPSDIFKGEYVNDFKDNDHWENFLAIWKKEWENMLSEYATSKAKLEATIPMVSAEEAATQDQKIVIKQFADASLSVYQMTKYFALLKGIRKVQVDDENGGFYKKIDLYLFGDSLEGNGEINKENNIYHYYNAFRNFLTKKPWSEDKIKLNFENGSLLNGWSQSKEDEYEGVFFEKDNLFYFGILRKKGLFDYRFREDDMYSGSGENRKLKDIKTIKKIWDRKCDLVNKIKKTGQNSWKKIEYYAIADPIKDVPGLLLSRANFQNKKKFKDMYEAIGGDYNLVLKIKKKETFKGSKRNLDDLYKIVDYYKVAIPKTLEKETYSSFEEYEEEIKADGYSNWRCFKFDFSPTHSYRDFAEFLSEVKDQGYKINIIDIDAKYIENCTKSGDLQLFQIYNKDFTLDQNLIDTENNGRQRNISGKEDIETTLFKMLFHDLNLKNKDGVVLALNGGAEIFYREPSLKKESEIRGKRRDGSPKKIERKRRYTENKIMLHVPIALNFGKPDGKYFKANDLINEGLQKSELTNKAKIIGIDRGEKHLAYYTVIDQEENILEQGTLNKIYPKSKDGSLVELDKKQIVLKEDEYGQKRYKLEPTGEKVNYIDYSQILDCKERNRLLQRKSWDSIENIKDLKKGYISHSVNKLCELFLDYFKQDGIPPMVVFEKLNVGFKQGRQKIEKQVYQNLELALAKKLGYLTKKFEKEEDQLLHGGVLRALQFVSEIKNYGSDIEKKSQVGVLLYTDPSYTSTTCPKCGFRKRMTKTSFESVKQAKAKLASHNLAINHNENKYKFTFITKQTSETGQECEIADTVFSNISRIYRKPKENKKGWTTDIYPNLTKQIDALFEGRIRDRSQEIFSQIKEIKEEDFWKHFMYYFTLILQIRNSSSKKYELSKSGDNLDLEGEDRDFIHCPHCYFHSDKQETWESFSSRFSSSLINELKYRGEDIFNGDVNGAYNIARKGRLMIDRIRQHPQIIEQFCKRNSIGQKDLKFKNGKFEITEGKGKDKKVIDSISQYPDLLIRNEGWDKHSSKP